jgi:tetratricopeptide (TPR) repeat protein
MTDVQADLERALELGEEGRWPEMVALLNRALEDVPDDPYLLCWLAVAERELGNDGVAYDLFRRCLEQEPTDPQLLALAGAGLAAFDDPEAEPALRAAALLAPDLPLTRLQYGAYLAREGLYDEALPHLQAAVALAPDDPVMHGELGIALTLKRDLAGAAAAMERALELAPDDSWTRVLLGLVALEMDETEEAARQLLQAAQERPEDAEAQVLAALAAQAVGWEDAAHDALARAEFAPESHDAQLIEDAEECISLGSAAARVLLLDTIAPSVLHERLTQPL